MAITLKIAEMTLDGLPHGCPECEAPGFTLDGRGLFDGLPVWGNCPSMHSWEHPLITLGILKQIQAASTGRQHADDEDTFEIVVGGAIIAGVLHPEVVLDDVKRIARDVYWRRLIRPALRKRKRKAARAVKGAARNGVAAAKAAAIGAAWGLQAGGTEPDPNYVPEPVNPCPACKGKGHHKIESRVHETTAVRCSVCSGTGEID